MNELQALESSEMLVARQAFGGWHCRGLLLTTMF